MTTVLFSALAGSESDEVGMLQRRSGDGVTEAARICFRSILLMQADGHDACSADHDDGGFDADAADAVVVDDDT